ncbi:MAG: EAL domain-containing protein [Actinobacteria bacterium]|nr:EAL domain-containing protein [Actinomycetota bacterium]
MEFTKDVSRPDPGNHALESSAAALIESSAAIACIFDARGKITYVSPSVERVLGYAPEEVIGRPGLELVHSEDARALSRRVTGATDESDSRPMEFRALHKDGSWRWLEMSFVDLRADPSVEGVVSVHRDITEHKRTQQQLQEAETMYRHLVEILPAIVYTVVPTEDGAWLYVSPQVEAILGYTPEEVKRDGLWNNYLHPEDRSRVLEEEALSRQSGEPFRSEYRLLAHDKRFVWMRDEATLVRSGGEHETVLQGFMVDVTERKCLEEQLVHQAFHDPLTNLANRPLFADRAQHALKLRRAEDAVVAVLFLDLDNFKAINDSLGHRTGDQLLVAVGERITDCLRAADTAARLGGDEFAILFENASDDSVVSVAQRILQELARPFELVASRVFITASAGLAFCSSVSEESDDLLRNADVAMYRAKSEGKGRYAIFEESMHSQLLDRLRLESELRIAIDEGQFVVHYHPLMDLASGAICGAEALVRWQHPHQGLLPPGDFIHIAEECGLIHLIGKWVLDEACRAAQKWRSIFDLGDEFSISVNLSARQLQRSDLIQHVSGALQESGLPAHRLTLEITESVLMRDTEATSKQLHGLRELGVKLAVDDFGTGYSSLGYLQSFPIDTLKIDRSFIAGISGGPEDSALARAIVKLGRSLNLETVAEGIEMAEQVSELEVIGCTMGQGFFYTEPLEETKMEALLKRASGEVISSDFQ